MTSTLIEAVQAFPAVLDPRQVVAVYEIARRSATWNPPTPPDGSGSDTEESYDEECGAENSATGSPLNPTPGRHAESIAAATMGAVRRRSQG